MKLKTKLLLFLSVTFSMFSFSQVTVEIQNMEIINGAVIGNCGTIDLEDNTSITVQFGVELKKPYNMAVGNGNLKIYTKKSSSDTENEEDSEIILSSQWTGSPNQDQFAYGSFSIPLDAVDFNVDDGVLFARYISSSDAEYDSCNYPIEKDEVPSFELSPSSVTVSCGSTSPETFTVTPSNIPTGATVTYNWDVGSGWLRNGSPVSTFTTTTTSVTLVPNSYPPSDVEVAPVLNTENYPQLTSDVSLSNFNPNYTIIGADDVCDTEIYSFDNLPNGISIQSASISNTSIATVSLDTSTNEVTVTRLSDGVVTLSMVVQNTCNQSKPFPKQLQIGVPATIGNALISGASDICGTQNYTYTLSGANHPCVTGIIWSVSPNLSIVSQNASSITVTANQNPFTTDNLYAGEIKANIPNSSIEITQGVWVGVPNNDGLSIQKLGSYDFFAGEWSQLKSHYTPFMYASNDPLNITFDWQIPNSQIRNFADTSRKDVNPNNIGQLTIGTRVVCGCGNGAWRFRNFTVTNSGNGNGFQMN